MDRATEKRIITIIDDCQDMTIATIRDDGFPQATTVSYVNDGLRIYFGCDATSQKAGNIAKNCKVSATINCRYNDWSDIKGLSIGAIACPVSDQYEIVKVGDLLYDKFPKLARYIPDDSNGFSIFRLDPIAISLLDYSKNFGHTELVEI